MQVLQTHIASYNQVPRSVDWLPPTLPSPLSASGMDAQELREFMAQYVSELADLTFNSKPIINTLTMLASENVKAASSITAAIEKHILKVRPCRSQEAKSCAFALALPRYLAAILCQTSTSCKLLKIVCAIDMLWLCSALQRISCMAST